MSGQSAFQRLPKRDDPTETDFLDFVADLATDEACRGSSENNSRRGIVLVVIRVRQHVRRRIFSKKAGDGERDPH